MSTRRYISSFRLENFGAFYNGGYPRIDLPNGENLLVYGENGSGKSSIYKAFSQFFESSVNPVTFNLNQQLPGQPGLVEIAFTLLDDGGTGVWQPMQSDIYKFNSAGASTNAENFIRQSNKLRGFLSYQQLVKTYALQTTGANNPNLYELIIEDLLWGHELPASQKTIETFWNELKPGLDVADGRRSEFIAARNQLPAFNADLQGLINTILPIVNQWLFIYFRYTVNVSLQAMPPQLSLGHAYVPVKQLYFNINHFGHTYQQYQNFLNEARLSAIAICIYLAGIKLNPSGTNYKLLFLDDIFVGLDTSNRLPLLEILKKEFSDFQIFMTTYDRNWFETAKHWMEFNSTKKWKSLEIFVDSQSHSFEIPLIISDSDNIKLAGKYFLKKDYPAAANALRRECENVIKKCLPDELRFSSDAATGQTFEIIQLETLYSNLIKFLEANNINAEFIKKFRFFQKNIFNPLSHSDITVPHYRQEISAALDFAKELRKLKVKKIVSVFPESYGVLSLDTRHNLTWQTQHYEISCLDNLYAIQFDNNPSVITNPRCNLYHLETSTNWYYFDHNDLNLRNVFKSVCRMCKYPKDVNPDLMYEWISNEDGEKLLDLKTF
ncbi:MAG: hypothetical protein QM781_11810 [Chitinophagaceae bacterium]